MKFGSLSIQSSKEVLVTMEGMLERIDICPKLDLCVVTKFRQRVLIYTIRIGLMLASPTRNLHPDKVGRSILVVNSVDSIHHTIKTMGQMSQARWCYVPNKYKIQNFPWQFGILPIYCCKHSKKGWFWNVQRNYNKKLSEKIPRGVIEKTYWLL